MVLVTGGSSNCSGGNGYDATGISGATRRTMTAVSARVGIGVATADAGRGVTVNSGRNPSKEESSAFRSLSSPSKSVSEATHGTEETLDGGDSGDTTDASGSFDAAAVKPCTGISGVDRFAIGGEVGATPGIFPGNGATVGTSVKQSGAVGGSLSAAGDPAGPAAGRPDGDGWFAGRFNTGSMRVPGRLADAVARGSPPPAGAGFGSGGEAGTTGSVEPTGMAAVATARRDRHLARNFSATCSNWSASAGKNRAKGVVPGVGVASGESDAGAVPAAALLCAAAPPIVFG